MKSCLESSDAQPSKYSIVSAITYSTLMFIIGKHSVPGLLLSLPPTYCPGTGMNQHFLSFVDRKETYLMPLSPVLSLPGVGRHPGTEQKVAEDIKFYTHDSYIDIFVSTCPVQRVPTHFPHSKTPPNIWPLSTISQLYASYPPPFTHTPASSLAGCLTPSGDQSWSTEAGSYPQNPSTSISPSGRIWVGLFCPSAGGSPRRAEDGGLVEDGHVSLGGPWPRRSRVLRGEQGEGERWAPCSQSDCLPAYWSQPGPLILNLPPCPII